MRKIKLTLTAIGAALAVLGFAGVAQAGVTPRVVPTDASGIAGYYLNNDGAHNFRDAKATFTVTSQMEQLSDGTSDGAVGAELCNSNDDRAIQAGVAWTGSAFEFKYAVGTVSGPKDPCVTGGLASFTNQFGGNVNSANLTVAVGDVVTVEVYASPKTGEVTLTASDLTQDATSQEHVFPQAQNYREAGIGVLDSESAGLNPPAILPVTTITGRFTNRLAVKSGTTLTGHGDLVAVTGLNSLTSPVLVPSALTAGKTFTVSAGISS